ncbi:SH3 domain-containing protein [Aestuariibius sp. 2305UL40-4]|uniref:SH3 domain-containing protein n=1 Tax=Aestuariibius violaceus TaxID=3234132 RepID=UPI003470C4E4
MSEKRRVTRTWTASYPDPISITAGARLDLTGKTDDWGGHIWLWAIAPDGREGWVPDTLPDDEGRARRDYSARELTCTEGDILLALDRTHGWTLCRSTSGAEGWVPDANLIPA